MEPLQLGGLRRTPEPSPPSQQTPLGSGIRRRLAPKSREDGMQECGSYFCADPKGENGNKKTRKDHHLRISFAHQ